jgi:hypothetical protein
LIDPATARSPDLALFEYISWHVFDHIEAAEEHGISQEGVLRRLSADGCKLVRPLESLSRKIDYKAGSTILTAAVAYGVPKTATRILAMGFPVNQVSSTVFRYALLTAACALGSETDDPASPRCKMVELLLQNGADVSLRDQFDRTALHVAAIHHPRVLLAVLGKEPDVNAQNVWLETPLHMARMGYHYPQIVEILLSHGARLDIRDDEGRTPLDVARSTIPYVPNRELAVRLMEEHARKSGCGSQAAASPA